MGVAGEPAGALVVGDGEAEGAVPELGEVFDYPAGAGEEAGEGSDTGGVDEAELGRRICVGCGDEEVAEVEVAVVEALGVKAGGEVGGGGEEGFEGEAGGDGLVAGAEAGEVFGDDDASAVGELAECDEGRGGDAFALEGGDAASFFLGGGEGGAYGFEAFDVQAEGLAGALEEVEGAVLAFGDGSPDDDAGVGEEGLGGEARGLEEAAVARGDGEGVGGGRHGGGGIMAAVGGGG